MWYDAGPRGGGLGPDGGSTFLKAPGPVGGERGWRGGERGWRGGERSGLGGERG